MQKSEGWLDTPFSLKNKTVFVAGGRGMVGSAVIRALSCEPCRILSPSRAELDLCYQAAVRAWFAKNKPDVVILAAAKVGGIAANEAKPADFLYQNLIIEANVIHAVYETSVEKLVFLGSSCIYPREAEQPIKPETLLSAPLEPTNEAYAVAKIAGVKLCEAFRKQEGCDFISLMPCNLYGIGDRYDERNSHVIPSLIMRADAERRKGAEQLKIWGTGRALREFLYIDDLADAVILALKNYSSAVPLNVGSSEEVRIAELTEMICETVGFDGEIIFDVNMPDGTPRKVMDNASIFSAGWRPKISLNDGLALAYQDYLERFVA
ncbi:MAG: GDP-L-fucose synthase [Micavibrio sp.]|nr:GDP-L-fucose synthase [Micavibrio sp.]